MRDFQFRPILLVTNWKRRQSILYQRMMIVLFFVFLTVSPQHCSAREFPIAQRDNSACENTPGSSYASLFFDFKKITIAYVTDPLTAARSSQDPAFPKELKSEAFIERTTKIVKENFSKCLKMDSGDDKPVVAIRGGVPANAFDPQNLIITIEFIYALQDQKKRNIDSPARVLRAPDINHVHLRINFFRAGINPADAYRAPNRTFFIPLETRSTQEIVDSLDKILRAHLKPSVP